MYTLDNFQIFMKIYTICILSVGILLYNTSPVYFYLPFINWSKKFKEGGRLYSFISIPRV